MPDWKMFKIIPDFLDNSAKFFSDKAGLIFEEKEYTYKEIKKEAEKIFYLLIDRTKKGEIAAILLPNTPEFVFTYFGILKSGCVALLLSPNISDRNLSFQVQKTRPKFVFSQKKFKLKLERSGVLKNTIFVDVDNLSEIGELGVKNNFRAVSESDAASVVFTSGTTSEPKGVKLLHSNVVSATKNIIEFLKFNENDTDVNISPLSHSFGLGHIHCIFAVGGTVVLFQDAINLKKIISTIIEKKATTFGAVPAILRLIADNYEDEFGKCGSLRFVQTNTSLLEAELIRKMMLILPGADFNYYYGLTEASRSTFITLNKHPDKIRSVGLPSPNVEIKIADAKGRELPRGKVGEICIRGKHVIQEYWENPEASKKIKDRWLYTGDAGCLDRDGYLYFKGRNDDIINVAGEKVSPEEIEGLIRKVSGIVDVAVIGAPDKLLGQVVKVFISTSESNFDKEKIIQECRNNLESYKVPKYVEIIDKIPRTENGKLRRGELRDKI